MTRGRLGLLGLLALMAVSVIALTACGDDDATTSTAAAAGSIPTVTITAHGFSFDAPDTIPAGITAVTLTNHGDEPHDTLFARLSDGVTTEQALAALQQGPDAALPLITLAGGIFPAEPGQTSEVILDFAPGQYLMLCFVSGEDGVPHVAKGMVKPFQVTGTPSASVQEPKADVEVVLRDFSFTMPHLRAGENLVKVTNAGHHPHEMILMKLLPGKSMADVEAFMQDESGPPPFEEAGGVLSFGGGGRAWVSLDLTPGNYLAVCFIPEPATGKPHLELGMIAPFTVQ